MRGNGQNVESIPPVLDGFADIAKEVNPNANPQKMLEEYEAEGILKQAGGAAMSHAGQQQQMNNQQEFYSGFREENGPAGNRQGSALFSDQRMAAMAAQQAAQALQSGFEK